MAATGTLVFKARAVRVVVVVVVSHAERVGGMNPVIDFHSCLRGGWFALAFTVAVGLTAELWEGVYSTHRFSRES